LTGLAECPNELAEWWWPPPAPHAVPTGTTLGIACPPVDVVLAVWEDWIGKEEGGTAFASGENATGGLTRDLHRKSKVNTPDKGPYR
jgi:hypothetical protein